MDSEQKVYLETIEKKLVEFESKLSGNKDQYIICEDDVKSVISCLKNGKSVGFSDVSNEMYKYGNLTLNLLANGSWS